MSAQVPHCLTTCPFAPPITSTESVLSSQADVQEVLSQTNAYLLAYVHICGEEIVGEGNRQPQHSQSQSRYEHDHAGVIAGQPWCPAAGLSAHTNHGLHPQDAECLDGSSAVVKQQAQQKASRDRKKQCGLAEADCKLQRVLPSIIIQQVRTCSKCAQILGWMTSLAALSLHPRGA